LAKLGKCAAGKSCINIKRLSDIDLPTLNKIVVASVAKMRADLYAQLEIPINRASALSHAVLFTGSFDSVFTTPNDLAKVTPDQVRAFATKYLVSTNRTIINRVPAPASPGAGKPGGAQ